ncbi:hypothetical protein ACJX0J_026452, partial [Zea mays]
EVDVDALFSFFKICAVYYKINRVVFGLYFVVVFKKTIKEERDPSQLDTNFRVLADHGNGHANMDFLAELPSAQNSDIHITPFTPKKNIFRVGMYKDFSQEDKISHSFIFVEIFLQCVQNPFVIV